MEALTRICLIGPESTGKSELAEELAKEFGVEPVPEYAREYAMSHGNDLSYADVEPIARGEIALLDSAPEDPIVLLDTDLISTMVYSRYYYDDCPEWIVDEARRRKADLYLLMDTDLPWEPDPARSGGGEEREELFDAFRRALDEFDTQWTIVSGNRDERRQRALAEIRRMTTMEP